MENIKVLKEKENPLFERKEIEITVESITAPIRQELEKLISKKFSSQIKNIKIKKIFGNFGSKIFTIIANIYSSEEKKNKIEPKSKKEREAEKKTEETIVKEQSENKEEKPAEENK